MVAEEGPFSGPSSHSPPLALRVYGRIAMLIIALVEAVAQVTAVLP